MEFESYVGLLIVALIHQFFFHFVSVCIENHGNSGIEEVERQK
jgi:hypothetical protein